MKNSCFTFILISLFLLPAASLFSQDETKQGGFLRYAGIEAGFVSYGSEFSRVDLIRKQGPFNYPSDIYNNTTLGVWHTGIKAEFRSDKYKLGVLTGLRYVSLSSASGNDYSDDNNDFFYFLHNESDTAIEYLRLRGLKHRANYIGIPLEVRYFIINSEYLRLYCKASAEIQYCLSSESDVFFLNEAMEIYQNDVIQKFDEPGNLFSRMYFSGGFNIGKADNINVNLEVVFLSFILSDNCSVINNQLAGGGFQVSIQMPF